MFNKIIKSLLGLVLTITFASAETELLVYTAAEVELLKPYKKSFEKNYPSIKIKWVRNSTGIVTAKLLAEKNNRRADVVFNLAGTSLVRFKNEGMLSPYAPKGVRKLNPKMTDGYDNPSWVGGPAWIAGICLNTIEMKNNNLPTPKSWADLTKAVYKGHIVMPNPASSGTGFLDVSSWIQMWGEDKAWSYMDNLHNNIAYYTHSGSKPCKLVGRGEVPIGISFIYKGVDLASKGAPVALALPSEGLGWELESSAIMQGTKKLDAAKKFIDWSVSDDASKIYNSAYAVIARSDIQKHIKGYPKNIDSKMIKNDFEWAATNRDRILKQWKKRYDGKSEAK